MCVWEERQRERDRERQRERHRERHREKERERAILSFSLSLFLFFSLSLFLSFFLFVCLLFLLTCSIFLEMALRCFRFFYVQLCVLECVWVCVRFASVLCRLAFTIYPRRKVELVLLEYIFIFNRCNKNKTQLCDCLFVCLCQKPN